MEFGLKTLSVYLNLQFLNIVATCNHFISVVPAILGLTAAAILAVTACFCSRRIRTRNKKVNLEQNNITFQPTRRPTAVRSPSGQPPHYLKKSPSPTATKPLPGTLLSPVQSVKYSEENETPKNATVTADVDNHNNNGDALNDNGVDNGKLGSLVFKLRYLADRNALVVSVVRCRGLPEKQHIVRNGDASNGLNGKVQPSTDPYVKLQLLPEKQHKVKTRYESNQFRFATQIATPISFIVELCGTHEIRFTMKISHSTDCL